MDCGLDDALDGDKDLDRKVRGTQNDESQRSRESGILPCP